MSSEPQPSEEDSLNWVERHILGDTWEGWAGPDFWRLPWQDDERSFPEQARGAAATVGRTAVNPMWSAQHEQNRQEVHAAEQAALEGLGIMPDVGSGVHTEPVTNPPSSLPSAPSAALTMNEVVGKDKAAWDTMIADAVKDENNAINERFGDVIAGLRADIADFQAGKTNVDSIYNSYQDAAGKIMREAVVDAEDLDPTGVVQKVGRSYDNAEGALNEALLAIDKTGRPEMAAAMNGELRFWENSITKALTSKVDMQGALHQSASAMAKSIAQAAYSDDQLKAETERSKLQLQFNASIRAKQEQLAQQSAARARARQKAKDWEAEQEEWEPDRDELYQSAATEYLRDLGASDEQIRMLLPDFEAAMQSGTTNADSLGYTVRNEEQFRDHLQRAINQDAASKIWIDEHTTLLQWWNTRKTNLVNTKDDENEDETVRLEAAEEIKRMDALYTNLDFAGAAQTLEIYTNKVMTWGLPGFSQQRDHVFFTPEDIGELPSIEDDHWSKVAALYSFDEEWKLEYDELVAGYR